VLKPMSGTVRASAGEISKVVAGCPDRGPRADQIVTAVVGAAAMNCIRLARTSGGRNVLAGREKFHSATRPDALRMSVLTALMRLTSLALTPGPSETP